jgi:NDP-sugar pyrophosphorylase family protein
VCDEIASGAKVDLATLLNKLSIAGELRAHEVHERFYEIGSPDGLDDFAAYIGARRADCE